jgi:diguanylate cyclase (GGDEF)-like protein/PAS domain S-box-containing protein
MIGKPSNRTAGGPGAFLHHGIPDLVVRKIIDPITQEEDAFQELFDRKAITAKVRAEQARLLYGSGGIIWCNAVLGIVTVLELKTAYPAWILISWLVALCLVVAARLVDRKMFLVKVLAEELTERWFQRFTLGCGVTGCLWGGLASSVAFSSRDPLDLVFITLVLGGATAAGVIQRSTYLPAFYAFTGPAVIPLAISLFTLESPIFICMGSAIAAFAVVMAMVGRHSHRWFIRSLRLQIEQGVLATDLQSKVAENQVINAELKQSETRFRTIFNSVSDAILVCDVETGGIVSGNERVHDLFGYATQEVVGLKLHDLSVEKPSSVRDELLDRLEGAKQGIQQSFEWQARTKQGHAVWVDVSLRRAAFWGEHFLLATVHDISQRKQAEAALVKMARVDGLTQLANRGLFVESLKAEIAQARGNKAGFAVLYLDLDHFKDINDTLGHPIGDRLLQIVADRIRESTRPGDTVARFGGDEFAVLATRIVKPDDAGALAERLLAAIGKPFSIEGNSFYIGASIGIAVHRDETREPEAILSHADVALYRAKADGRHRCCFFTDSMEQEVHSQFTLIAELREAISTNQLFLRYQPQVEIETGRVVGIEALMRWQHPKHGELSPAVFLPAAEETGLILTLNQWMLLETCQQLKRWRDKGTALSRVAINLSLSQFKGGSTDLERDLDLALNKYGLAPDALELELAEAALMQISAENRGLLQRLRTRGIKVAIDDFGTGYSSLLNLRRFPVDRIKLAQDFVADLVIDQNAAAIVRASIGLASVLGMAVIAEGVETAAQARLLKEWGCPEAQGYYFAKPMLADEISTCLQSGRLSGAAGRGDDSRQPDDGSSLGDQEV